VHDVGFGHIAGNNLDFLVESGQVEWDVEDAQDVCGYHA
jgi:hypothetical protein